MKRINKFKGLNLWCMLFLTLGSCETEVTDFGFDGNISGMLKEASGKIVPGDLSSNNLVVNVLAEGDKLNLIIRVNGDGIFKNSKLKPVNHKIWISGPVFPIDTIYTDLASGAKSFNQELVVVPFLSIETPVVIGTPTSSSVEVKFNIVGNEGKQAARREVYCSTVKFPTTSTGSGVGYHTVKKTLISNNGIASITGLTAGTKYYLRLGAQATGTTYWNYSEQIIINTSE